MPSLPKRMNEPLLIFHSPHNITDTTNSTGTPWQTRAIHQRVTEEKAKKSYKSIETSYRATFSVLQNPPKNVWEELPMV